MAMEVENLFTLDPGQIFIVRDAFAWWVFISKWNPFSVLSWCVFRSLRSKQEGGWLNKIGIVFLKFPAKFGLIFETFSFISFFFYLTFSPYYRIHTIPYIKSIIHFVLSCIEFTECVSRSGDTAGYNIRRNLERPDGTRGWVCKTSMQSPRLSKTWDHLETGGWRRDYFPCRIVWWQNEMWV